MEHMPEFREFMRQQALGASSNTTQASNLTKNREPAPAARSLERTLSQSTAPATARNAGKSFEAEGDRARGGGERVKVTLLRLTNPDNEVAFTTGGIKSVLATIAHQEGFSKEYITPQMLQGGRGPGLRGPRQILGGGGGSGAHPL